ncbi:unnamed protein product [Malus baccata var. baccata]
MVSRLGLNKILQRLIDARCNINYQLSDRIWRNRTNDLLASGAADFGLVNSAGQSASVIAESARWALGFQQAVAEAIRSGEIAQSNVDLNEQDERGCSAAMIAAEGGYLETFKLLIDSGADINLQNKHGQKVMELFNTNHDSEEFEKLLLKNTHLKRTQHQAVQHNATDFVHTLIGRGSDLM